MNDRAGLIKRHLSVNMQGEIGSTYDTTQDMATKRVLVPQPKIGQDSRLILRYCVAGDHGVNTYIPNNSERLTSGGV